MNIRHGLTLCALIVSSVVSVPALAAVNIGVEIGVPPPAARIEVVPAARLGYIWAPGYWRWEGDRHAWVEGHWIEARPGFFWVPERWEARGRRHHFEPGHWEREGRRERERVGENRG